ncbi:unnamed protein product, partial [Hapterophycus canaliculatus]
ACVSPIRWEKQGVLRNSLQNICFALLYVVGNLSADQIFRLYYGRPPPERAERAPPPFSPPPPG